MHTFCILIEPTSSRIIWLYQLRLQETTTAFIWSCMRSGIARRLQDPPHRLKRTLQQEARKGAVDLLRRYLTVTVPQMQRLCQSKADHNNNWAVYIPPDANVSTAVAHLHSAINKQRAPSWWGLRLLLLMLIMPEDSTFKTQKNKDKMWTIPSGTLGHAKNHTELHAKCKWFQTQTQVIFPKGNQRDVGALEE